MLAAVQDVCFMGFVLIHRGLYQVLYMCFMGLSGIVSSVYTCVFYGFVGDSIKRLYMCVLWVCIDTLGIVSSVFIHVCFMGLMKVLLQRTMMETKGFLHRFHHLDTRI